ncbi:hypothetical protein MASR2M16_12300 [Thauera terpenica]
MANIFLSYGRSSEAITTELAGDLTALGHEVWFDRHLSGGQQWWDAILASIRKCEIFVFVLDPGSLDSRACRSEYRYGAALGKSILPVRVSTEVSTTMLPVELSQLQYVDYLSRDHDSALKLARAIGSLKSPGPLPDPLPEPPPPPVSRLGELAARLNDAGQLGYEQQAALLIELKTLLRDQPSAADDARKLLERLRQRPGTFAVVADEIDELLARRGRSESLTPEQGSAGSSTAYVKREPDASEAFGKTGFGNLLQTLGDRQRLGSPALDWLIKRGHARLARWLSISAITLGLMMAGGTADQLTYEFEAFGLESLYSDIAITFFSGAALIVIGAMWLVQLRRWSSASKEAREPRK